MSRITINIFGFFMFISHNTNLPYLKIFYKFTTNMVHISIYILFVGIIFVHFLN